MLHYARLFLLSALTILYADIATPAQKSWVTVTTEPYYCLMNVGTIKQVNEFVYTWYVTIHPSKHTYSMFGELEVTPYTETKTYIEIHCKDKTYKNIYEVDFDAKRRVTDIKRSKTHSVMSTIPSIVKITDYLCN